MATLAEILGREWLGSEWSLSGDDYSTLVWISATPKPTEQGIRVFSAEVDAEIQAEVSLARKRDILDQADSLLQAFEILVDAVADIQAKARVTSALTGSNLTKISALAAKLAQIRAN